MNRLLGTPVVGLGVVGIGGGIRCRASPFARIVLKSVKARASDDDCRICRGSVDNTAKMESEIDFSLIFSKEEKARKEAGHPKELHYGSIFIGNLEKRYLDYLSKIEWRSMRDHISNFPRGGSRSEDELKVIFEKWVSHFGKVFYDESHRKETFDDVKEVMAWVDDKNSTDKLCRYTLNERSA